MHVVLAAGGTAGHIFPALNTAVAIRTLSPDTQITILGTRRGLDSELVPPAGFPLHLIDSVPFPRKINSQTIRFPLRLLRAVKETKAFFKKENVQCVVGFGGYASAPAYLAARSLGICMIVHEANSTPGIANRLGARLTRNIAVNQAGVLSGGRVIGMPISENIRNLDRKALNAQARNYFSLPSAGKVLLVFGGSQGARSINSAIELALPDLLSAGIHVVHAVGAMNEIRTPEVVSEPHSTNAQSTNPQSTVGLYRPVPFIDRMDLAYAVADLSINRAGAMTVAEIAAIGLPAVFVPLPIGNGEQEKNAQFLVNAGGALTCTNDSFTPDWIKENVIPLLNDPVKLVTMSEKTLGTSSRDAAQELARWALACEGD